MVYPGRPVREPLPQFVGTAGARQTPEQREALLEFVAAEYQAGRSLRELGELTARSQTVLCTCQVPRPWPGGVAD